VLHSRELTGGPLISQAGAGGGKCFFSSIIIKGIKRRTGVFSSHQRYLINQQEKVGVGWFLEAVQFLEKARVLFTVMFLA